METLISVNERGSLTLPKEVRVQIGLPKGGPVRVQVTNEGVLLVPVAAFPVEIYTKDRLEEFAREEAALGKYRLE